MDAIRPQIFRQREMPEPAAPGAVADASASRDMTQQKLVAVQVLADWRATMCSLDISPARTQRSPHRPTCCTDPDRFPGSRKSPCRQTLAAVTSAGKREQTWECAIPTPRGGWSRSRVRTGPRKGLSCH